MTNPVTTYAAMYMWMSSCQRKSLPKSAFHGWTFTTRPATSRKPLGWFIHALTEMTIHDPRNPVTAMGDPAEQVHARREPVPAVHVDAQEDRLEEEREPLDGEAESEDTAERRREVGPQHAHLEAQHRAGDRADREQRDHRPAPPARDRPTQRVAGALRPPLHEQHHHREGDAEAHQRDVGGERQRLHLPRLEQVVLRHRAQRQRAVG